MKINRTKLCDALLAMLMILVGQIDSFLQLGIFT